MSTGSDPALDWNRVSDDYARFRSGPPASFYARLRALGVGVPGQRLLDLGTGPGILARTFARAGARVAGIDASHGQIERAKKAAAEEGLQIDFRVATAEETPFGDRSFDAVTGNQCWHFFDGSRALDEVRRVLVPGGLLVVSDFFWMAGRDPVAAATEDLILKFSPGWTGYRWSGELPARPDLTPLTTVEYEEPIPFTRDSWRGRIRTCRAVGPVLEPRVVAAFDEEHRRLLEKLVPEKFEVRHRVLAHVYRIGR